MRRSLLAGAALALVSGAALAADLASRPAPAPIAAPAFTWTGFHAGVNLGGAFGNGDWRIDPAPATFGLFVVTPADSALLARRYRSDEAGITGGAQIGFDYQIGRMVVGAEADLNLLDRSHSDFARTDLVTAFAGAPVELGITAPLRFETELARRADWFATARMRLGYTPFERLMLYVTGGLAFGETRAALAADVIPAAALFPDRVNLEYGGRRSSVDVGWAGGLGLEYALLDNLSVKLEYLHVDLGTTRFLALPVFRPLAPFPQPAAPAPPVAGTVAPAAAGAAIAVRGRNEFQIGRIGLNYRF